MSGIGRRGRVFKVGLSRDVRGDDGDVVVGDLGLSLLEDADGVEWEFLREDVDELTSELVEGYDALLVFGPAVTAATLTCTRTLALVARIGVGYEEVDVDALTRNGILLTITPDGVRRPMASGALAFLLALSHKLVLRDRLIRSGLWSEGLSQVGTGLSGRTLGVIGLGNIGRELLTLVRPFGMRHLVADPYVTPGDAAAHAAELVDLDTLLADVDFVCVMCLLTDETSNLLDRRRLGLMRPTSFLINVARGGLVDQEALTEALEERRIAGAALDVFTEEPIDPLDPLLSLDNVVLAPHSIGGTDELYLGSGESACAAILSVARGQIPRHLVNRNVLTNPLLQRKLRGHAGRAGAAA